MSPRRPSFSSSNNCLKFENAHKKYWWVKTRQKMKVVASETRDCFFPFKVNSLEIMLPK